MNYRELKKLATPGPLTCGKVRSASVFDIVGADVTGKGREVVGSFYASQTREANAANAALFIHCVNNFDEALEALKDIATVARGNGHGYFDVPADRIRDARKLVAGLEEVKQ